MSASSLPTQEPFLNAGAFLRALTTPLLVWGGVVAAITLAGQPGVVCITPMAWLLSIWSGKLYVTLSQGNPGRRPGLAAALLGALLGLGLGALFILTTTLAMPSTSAEEAAKAQVLSAIIGVAGVFVCAGLCAFIVSAALRRSQGRAATSS